MFMAKITTIVLTGGQATRMYPLSINECKSMISFMGKPLLLSIVSMLRQFQFKDIIFTSPGKKGEIEQFFSNGDKYDVNIRYYSGKKWSGTAGIVKNIVMEMDVSDTIMVVYGDSLLRVNYFELCEFHKQKASNCTILYHHPKFQSFLYEYHDKDLNYINTGQRTNYGVLDIDMNGRITYAEEKPLLSDIKEKFNCPVANATVYTFTKDILEYVPEKSSFDFPKDLFPKLLDQGVICYGFDINNGYREDIGTLQHYYKTQFDILMGKLEFDHYFPSLANGKWVAESSRLNPIEVMNKRILIGEHCKIMKDAMVECSIIGNNVSIGDNSTIKNSIILDNVFIGTGVSILNSIVGSNSYFSDNVVLPTNTILGCNCILGKKDFFSFNR